MSELERTKQAIERAFDDQISRAFSGYMFTREAYKDGHAQHDGDRAFEGAVLTAQGARLDAMKIIERLDRETDPAQNPPQEPETVSVRGQSVPVAEFLAPQEPQGRPESAPERAGDGEAFRARKAAQQAPQAASFTSNEEPAKMNPKGAHEFMGIRR